MSTIERIKANLERKKILLGRLESLLEEERRGIVSLDVSTLERLEPDKRSLIEEIERIGTDSRELIRQEGVSRGLGEEVSLSALIPVLPSGQREPLESLRREVLEAGERVDRIIAVNRDLLVASLRSVNASLEFFHRMFTLGSTYGEGGKISEESGVHLVSREV